MRTSFLSKCPCSSLGPRLIPPQSRQWPFKELADHPSSNQSLRCKGHFLGVFPPVWLLLRGRWAGSALGNEALWSLSSSFYFFSFHFPSHQKPPGGGSALSSPFPVISLSCLPRHLFWARPCSRFLCLYTSNSISPKVLVAGAIVNSTPLSRPASQVQSQRDIPSTLSALQIPGKSQSCLLAAVTGWPTPAAWGERKVACE